MKMVENPDGEIDENFWATAAAERMQDGQEEQPGKSILLRTFLVPKSGKYAHTADPDSGPIPFESQFFHADADDDYNDDVLDAPSAFGDPDGEVDDLWQGTQGQELRKAKPENVNFAKKAKRVDVKRLKDDIWKGLKDLVPDETESPRDSVSRRPSLPASEPDVYRIPLLLPPNRRRNLKHSTTLSPPSAPHTPRRRCPRSPLRSASSVYSISRMKRGSESRRSLEEVLRGAGNPRSRVM